MLLAIDIGNTNINLGIFKANRLIKRYAIATKEKNYFAALEKIVRRHRIITVVICSVVPQATKQILTNLNSLSISPYIIGKEIKVPIVNRYRYPEQVGQDRLVNAYGASVIYGVPLIVVDFGTAITFDIIAKNCQYLGGMIIPGLQISLDVLRQRTALLPGLKIEKPKEFIGRDTKSSMLSGIIYGYAALTDTLILQIKNKVGRRAKVIGTGGDIRLMAKYCRNFSRQDPDLTLSGLNLLHNLLNKN